jgi:UDP-N-acetylmuramyl-tripeptide synthetase
MVGVTGTNGKTTTTWLIEALLRHGGKNPGMLGTVAVKMGGQMHDAHNTTPLSLDLQELLGQMRGLGHDSVAMEVSSHGLSLDRVYGIPYDVAVFTNLTQDHLDFHGSMEKYFKAKRLLFERLGQDNPKSFPVRAVVNADDPYAGRFLEATQVPHLTYGVTQPADIRAQNVVSTFSGTRYTVATATTSFDIEMRLAGMFNVYNSLAAIATALAIGLSVEQIQEAMRAIPPVRGRFELIDERQDFAVVVDYAHTPDGLENILKAARPMTSGKLITVFGCGGDRDRTKRPIMGRITAKYADHPIITSDNPRTEDPNAIVRDIEVGVKESTSHYEMIVDRQSAIEHALRMARTGDTVVIAGKGHETYQIFKDRTIHFDDAEVARNFLRNTLTGTGVHS